MTRLALALVLGLALADEPSGPINPASPVRRPAPKGEVERWGWLADPRSAVLLTLGAAAVFGGGRKLLKGMQARRAWDRLQDPDVRPEEIVEAARYGRDGLMDLFRLLETAPNTERRSAAARAIAALWKRDELIAEEEKSLVRRGFVVDWKARRRYPRDLVVPIPIRVGYGVPALRDAADEVGPGDLAWSHRIAGAQRASLEEFTPWVVGPGFAAFAINPGDFAGNGPHRLVLQARARTEGLTDPWEMDLPHVPFTFELDPNLRVDALLGGFDAAREDLVRRSVVLRSAADPDGPSRFLPLNDDFLLRDPPALSLAGPLPSDLAHAVSLEFEGVPGRFPAGAMVVSGTAAATADVPLAPSGPLPTVVDRPGTVRLRAVLEPDPHRGWADPDVRSIWPGTIVTDWAEAQIVRR